MGGGDDIDGTPLEPAAPVIAQFIPPDPEEDVTDKSG